MLVGKNDDVLAENNEEIADLFSLTTIYLPLISVNPWIAPERQKRFFAKVPQVLFGRSNTAALFDRLILRLPLVL